jgi:hypothetical protein
MHVRQSGSEVLKHRVALVDVVALVSAYDWDTSLDLTLGSCKMIS